jgi:uroporphyrinogen-III synthase
LPDDDTAALRLITAVVAGRVDAVTFTSAPALRNLFVIADRHGLGPRLRTHLANGVVAACVGPVCIEAAVDCGIGDAVVPERFRIGPMIRTLTDRLSDNAIEVELGGQRLVLRGAGLVTEDGLVTLAARELAILRYLAERSPAVVAKAELLRSLWPDEVHDGHAIEVAVARLRKRLGPLGASIVSVPKRGYVLA